MKMDYVKQIDLLTKEQRMQLERIKDVVTEAEDFLSDLWYTIDYDVCDILEGDQHEFANFEHALQIFIFQYLMGEKLPPEIKQ